MLRVQVPNRINGETAMLANRLISRSIIACLPLLLVTAEVARTRACGGFFCQQFQIAQAAEQIIFHQDGDTVTAIVQIQYQGAAQDFSWVVPVNGIPELSLSSDLLFQNLESLTRPQFTLDINGSTCITDRIGGPIFSLAGAAPESSDAANDAIEVLARQSVGPFDVQVVSSTDADALARWLAENNYDLTDRGAELIAPYVELGMNFVAVRLQQDRGVGDVQPLKMVYKSEHPMIPIRLTAVATQPNLGVLVWLLGPGRAVPVNYLHVTPNYAQLDWYRGTFAAFASYQNLITAAMDDAAVGGQGFATDYAGRDSALLQPLLDLPDQLAAEAARLLGLPNAADALGQLLNFGQFNGAKVLEIYRRRLPLPSGTPEFTYGNPSLLGGTFSIAELRKALTDALEELETDVIKPLRESLTVFDGDPYMTRMYTTLSAEEMTLDPCFGFNAELEEQPLERKATLDVECVLGETVWSVTLGQGTGRDGELLIEGNGPPPAFVPVELAAQSPVKLAEMLRESAVSAVVVDNTFTPILNPDLPVLVRLCGFGVLPAMLVSFAGLAAMHARSRLRRR
jgi:hypothetical protein